MKQATHIGFLELIQNLKKKQKKQCSRNFSYDLA